MSADDICKIITAAAGGIAGLMFLWWLLFK